MNIAIVDDEHVFTEETERLLRQIDVVSHEFFVDIFTSGKDLLQSLADTFFDIIILDIEMAYDGIKTAKKIRELFNDQLVKIIFLSGHENYYKELYEFKPVAFVSKPIQKEEFEAAVIRCIKQFDDNKNQNDIFEYKIQTTIRRVLQKDILYFESISRKMRIVYCESEDMFYSTVQKALDCLRDDLFVQVRESHIVNFDMVQDFLPNGFVMRNGDKITTSKTYSNKVKKRIKQYLGWRNQ